MLDTHSSFFNWKPCLTIIASNEHEVIVKIVPIVPLTSYTNVKSIESSEFEFNCPKSTKNNFLEW